MAKAFTGAAKELFRHWLGDRVCDVSAEAWAWFKPNLVWLLPLIAGLISGWLKTWEQAPWSAVFLFGLGGLGVASLVVASIAVMLRAIKGPRDEEAQSKTPDSNNSSIEVFVDRAGLVKARGTIDDELKDVERAWVVWPCGTGVPGFRESTIRKIERAIFTDIIKPADFAPYSEMLTIGSYPFRLNLYNATKKITDVGGRVVWHRHPTTSLIIANPNGIGGWARIELLLPYTQAAERVNLIVRADQRDLFVALKKSFEAMWTKSVDPVFEGVTIPPSTVFVETSAKPSWGTSEIYGPGRLTVESARYGFGDTWADVTETLQGHVHNDRTLALMVTNENLRGDPYPNQHKELVVSYALDGVRQPSVTVSEKGRLVIPPVKR